MVTGSARRLPDPGQLHDPIEHDSNQRHRRPVEFLVQSVHNVGVAVWILFVPKQFVVVSIWIPEQFVVVSIWVLVHEVEWIVGSLQFDQWVGKLHGKCRKR